MIDKFIKNLKSLYENKNYLILSGYSVLLLLMLVCSIMITYFICVNVFNFIAQRFEAVIAIVGAYLMIYFWWKDKQNKQQQQAQLALLEKTAAQQSADKALAESHYSITRQCLYSTLQESAVILNLQKPDMLSELDSPSRLISKANVYMCQFVVVKNGECNTDKIKELLQMRIAQKLSAHEFAGITQTTYIHNGMAYPLLCIDEIRDNGSFLQVDVAWASESYCSLLDSRAQAKLENLKPPSISYRDGDF